MAQTTIQGSFLGDGTVTGVKIGADFISAQTALASGLATTDEIIVSDAGVIKRMDISVLRITADQITASGTLPALNGAALTALSAANITASGTLPALNGAALTALSAANITASGTLPALVGTALTALDASNLSTGTVNVARIAAASTGASGIVELAIASEVDTGTSATLAVTPDALAGSNYGEKVIQMVCVDFATALTTGSKFYFHVPSTLNGFDIVDVHAEVITAGVGANLITIDLHNVRHAGGDVDILSTNITINASATGSDTATTAAVINSGAGYDALATNDVIRVDIDQIGNTTAGSGLIVTMICRLP